MLLQMYKNTICIAFHFFGFQILPNDPRKGTGDTRDQVLIKIEDCSYMKT